MFSMRTHIPCAIAIALLATLVTNASAFDRLKKEPGFLYVASFNVYKFGAIETEEI